jgi:hypothetical protein
MELQEKFKDANSQNSTDVWPHNIYPKPVVVPEAKVTITIRVKESYLIDKKNQLT